MSDVGRLPGGWLYARLSEVADVKLGKMLSPKAMERNLVARPYLRNENVRWGRVAVDDVKQMGFRPHELSRYSVEPGDLLVCEGGEPGRCAVYAGPPETYAYQKALHRVRTIHAILVPQFLQYWLWHLASSGALAPRIAQTTIQHLPLERFVELPVLLPPGREQVEIVRVLDSAFSRLEEAVGLLELTRRHVKRYRAAVLIEYCIKNAMDRSKKGELRLQDARP